METTTQETRVNGCENEHVNLYSYWEWRVKQFREENEPLTAKMARNAHRMQVIALAPSCIYCGKLMTHEKMTLDHIRPRSRGGSDSKANLAICCGNCNQAKANRGPLRWALAIIIGSWRWRLAAWIRG